MTQWFSCSTGARSATRILRIGKCSACSWVHHKHGPWQIAHWETSIFNNTWNGMWVQRVEALFAATTPTGNKTPEKRKVGKKRLTDFSRHQWCPEPSTRWQSRDQSCDFQLLRIRWQWSKCFSFLFVFSQTSHFGVNKTLFALAVSRPKPVNGGGTDFVLSNLHAGVSHH